MHICKVPISRMFPLILAAILLSSTQVSCSLDNWQTDIEDFVELGLSTAYLKSSSHSQNGLTDSDVAHGTPVTVTAEIANPKSLILAYALNCDASLVSEPAPPTIADSGETRNGIAAISFTFTPAEAAEHGDIVFTLGINSPSIGKTFNAAGITVRCDSAPNPVENLIAGVQADATACIGFTLPEGYTDSDISAVRITRTNTLYGTSVTETKTVSRTGTELTELPNPPLLDSDAGQYVRYFIPDGMIAGNPYSFTVTSIDESGKTSVDSETVSVTGKEVYLAYDANGGTGVIGAAVGYNERTVEVSSARGLSYEHHEFLAWNTARDGSGATYIPGDAYTFTLENAILYVQWLPLGTINVTVTISLDYASLTFTPATISAQRGSSISILPNDGSLRSSGANWKWYVDGTAIEGANSIVFVWDTSGTSIGEHTVSCAVDYEGITYSGSIIVAVTAPYTVSYDGNGNTGGSAPDAQRFISGESVALTPVAASFVKSGYAFAGWATTPTAASVTYADGATTESLSSSVVLYAVWANVAPGAVTDLSAIAGDRKATLSWTDPADEDLAYIKVAYTGGNSGSVMVSAGAQRCAIKELTNGANYVFTVTAYDEKGAASSVATINCVPVEGL